MKLFSNLTANQRKWLRRAIELLLIVVVILTIRTWQQRDMVSGQAPALGGRLLDLKAYEMPQRPTQPVLVHFWATWCPVCRTEQGSIESLSSSGYPVMTVAMQSGDATSVQRFMADQKLSFPVINDPDGVLSEAWGVRAVPATFIIDRDGQVRFVEVGYTTEWGMRLRLWLADRLS